MNLKLIITKPKLREETFFVISFTVILMFIINFHPMIMRSLSLEDKARLFFILLPFFLMMFFSVTKYTIDDPRWGSLISDFIIGTAIITEMVFVGIIGMYFFVKSIENSFMLNVWNILLVISALINITQSVIMGAFLRMTPEWKELYIGGNADKKLLIICGLIIIATLLIGKFLLREDPILTASLALSFSTLVINFKYDFHL